MDDDNVPLRSRRRGPYLQWLATDSNADVPKSTARANAKRLRQETGDQTCEQSLNQIQSSRSGAIAVGSNTRSEGPQGSRDETDIQPEVEAEASQANVEAEVDTARGLDLPQDDEPAAMNHFLSDTESEDQNNETGDNDTNDGSDFQEAFETQLRRDLSKPINERVVMTAADILLGVLQISQIRKLNNQCLLDIVQLFNVIFEKPILPTSQFLLDKLLFNKSGIHFNFYCTECHHGFGEIPNYAQVKNVICEVCRAKNNISDVCVAPNYVILDLNEQLNLLLNEFWDQLYDPLEREHCGDEMSDIYQGQVYQHFQSSLPAYDKDTRVISLSFCVDGAPLFSSSKHDVWPVTFMINELPPTHRMKNAILGGLWFGTKKPVMDLFMESVANYIVKLPNDGIILNIKGNRIRLKVYLLACCVDTVARAPVQGINQFNGEYVCGWCYHPGVYILDRMLYPTEENDVIQERTHEEIVEHGRELLEKQEYAARNRSKMPEHVEGVKQVSPLAMIVFFNLVGGMIVDYMHAALLGVAKAFMKIWLSNTGSPGYIGDPENLEKLNKRLISLKPPIEVRRLPRKITDWKFFKAREWENWVLYYSIPVLSGILPANLLKHWILFVESMHILLKEKITSVDIQKAASLIRQFVSQAHLLYEDYTVNTFNLHVLTHFPTQCKRWGPLYCISSFGFEDYIGRLKSLIHANRGIPYQICRSLSHTNALNFMIQSPLLSAEMKEYAKSITKRNKAVKQSSQFGNVRVFGLEKAFVPSDEETWICQTNCVRVPNDNIVILQKAVFKTLRILPYNPSHRGKSLNSCILLTNGDITCIRKIVCDKDNYLVFILGSVVQTEPLPRLGIERVIISSVQKRVRIYDEITFVPINNVKSVVSFSKISATFKYVTPMPYVVNTN